MSELTELLSAVESEVARIKENVGVEQKKLATVKATVLTHETLAKTAQNDAIKAREQATREKKALEEGLIPLRKEKFHLTTEISESVTKKADLKLENARLFEENNKFKTYEEKAWKVLRAKEDELLERELAIEQKESLSPRNKSLLPPISE